MRQNLTLTVILFLLFVTSCSSKNSDEAVYNQLNTNIEATTVNQDTIQDDDQVALQQTELQNADLEKLIENFDFPPQYLKDLEFETDGQGFPIELINKLRKAVYNDCSELLLRELNDESLIVTIDEFSFEPNTNNIDRREEDINNALQNGASDFYLYKLDSDGDGNDEIFIVPIIDGSNIYGGNNRREAIIYSDSYYLNEGSLSSVYMLSKSRDNYIYSGYRNIEDDVYSGYMRYYAIFQYSDEFYLAASYNNYDTGNTDVKLFALNNDKFVNQGNIDRIYIQKKMSTFDYYLLYKNKNSPIINDVQVYLNEIIKDLLYAAREHSTHSTFYGDEKWSEVMPMYAIDVNNDGQDEFFTRSNSYLNGWTYEFNWYSFDLTEYSSPFSVFESAQYDLTKIWFKVFNGKTVIFSLYGANNHSNKYIIDVRIYENDKTTILLDYVVSLKPSGILLSKFGYGNDMLGNYLPLDYRDPDFEKAFPKNLNELAMSFITREQGKPGSEFEWKKIYSNNKTYEKIVTDYVDGIKDGPMSIAVSIDNEEIYMGDETCYFDSDKLLRLKSFQNNFDNFFAIDFNNDGEVEYFAKKRSGSQLYCRGPYKFTDKRTVITDYNIENSQDKLIQFWFKELEGKVFTFKLFLNDDSYYFLNVSLVEGTDITQVQSYIIAPKSESNVVTGK